MTPIRWPGGEHRFELRLGELRALQKNCDAGPEEVFNRLRAGRWRVDDVIEPRPGKWRFSRIYGNGAVLGFTPAQVDEMTLWQFLACLDGVRAARGEGSTTGHGEGFEEHELRAFGVEGF